MIQVRAVGEGLYLVSIETALGRLNILLSGSFYLGDLAGNLRAAMAQRLADDMLGLLARTVLPS